MHVSFQRTKLYNRFFTTKAPIHNNFEVLYVSSLFRKVVLMLMKPFVRVYSELGVGCGYWNPVTTSKLPGYIGGILVKSIRPTKAKRRRD